jgi:hypothetical protein
MDNSMTIKDVQLDAMQIIRAIERDKDRPRRARNHWRSLKRQRLAVELETYLILSRIAVCKDESERWYWSAWFAQVLEEKKVLRKQYNL